MMERTVNVEFTETELRLLGKQFDTGKWTGYSIPILNEAMERITQAARELDAPKNKKGIYQGE